MWGEVARLIWVVNFFFSLVVFADMWLSSNIMKNSERKKETDRLAEKNEEVAGLVVYIDTGALLYF